MQNHAKAPSFDENSGMIRHDWQRDQVKALLDQPFNDLLFSAHSLHRQFHDPNELQLSTLMSIKTGKCSEDCGYCSQSARYDTDLEDQPLLDRDTVLAQAGQAKKAGATRFCMGAAWRSPRDRDMPALIEIVQQVKSLGLETCLTAGMLTAGQSEQLKVAGLDFYNHNLDTSPEYYPEIISTHSYAERLDTLAHVRQAGISVCSGGIIGMGESEDDRIGLLLELANLDPHPDSVPINMLVKIEGTPMETSGEVDPLDFIRMIALARIMMPRAAVRLSAGREEMSDEMHALCFFAGANSIFYGDMLLTTANASSQRDRQLMKRLGLQAQTSA